MPSGPWLMLGICSLSVLVLDETLLVPVHMYGREKERSRVRAVQKTTSGDCQVLGGWIESQMDS